MQSFGIAAILLFLALTASAGQNVCDEIQAEFAPLEHLEMPGCEDAAATQRRFSVQLPELLRGCRELAAFDISQGSARYHEQSLRFRNRVIYEFLPSPADAKESAPEAFDTYVCEARIGPLMQFRQHTLAKLLRFDDQMDERFHGKAFGQ
jgi:hypothetical protein